MNAFLFTAATILGVSQAHAAECDTVSTQMTLKKIAAVADYMSKESTVGKTFLSAYVDEHGLVVFEMHDTKSNRCNALHYHAFIAPNCEINDVMPTAGVYDCR